jgi:hypothetical protein
MRDTKSASGAYRVFVRRDRWGRLGSGVACIVCGRVLWVNWTRARPCLWCDDSAEAAEAVSGDELQGRVGGV